MPKKGFTNLTISDDLNNQLEKLRKKAKAKSRQQILRALVKGALD